MAIVGTVFGGTPLLFLSAVAIHAISRPLFQACHQVIIPVLSFRGGKNIPPILPIRRLLRASPMRKGYAQFPDFD
jgi:hypothetical protein